MLWAFAFNSQIIDDSIVKCALQGKNAPGVALLTRLAPRRGGRVVYRTGLENRQGLKSFVGSNPTLSAIAAVWWAVADLGSDQAVTKALTKQ